MLRASATKPAPPSFDVVDPEGKYLGEVQARFRAPARASIIFQNNAVYVPATADMDLPTCYD
ncbi:hypothetical protein HRbin33_02216 [bacterium HR33]|nr:hypothetical protein HRbin33_02216 [bacterium HR33]